MLRNRNVDSNYFEVEIPVIFYRYFFLDKELYYQKSTPKPNSVREHPIDKAKRFFSLMKGNGWNQAELARQLGMSRARITQILNVLKIPVAEIERMKEYGVMITKRR